MAVIKTQVRSGVYYDSARLMQLQRTLANLPGVEDAGVIMGTETNKELLARVDLLSPEAINSRENDLVIVVSSDDPKIAEEAIAKVVARLQALKDHGQAHTLVFLSGRSGRLRQRLLRRFLQAYGSPNLLHAPTGLDSASRAVYLQQGMHEGLAYDLDRTRYLVSFGANLLEGWGSPAGEGGGAFGAEGAGALGGVGRRQEDALAQAVQRAGRGVVHAGRVIDE